MRNECAGKFINLPMKFKVYYIENQYIEKLVIKVLYGSILNV